MAHRKLIQDYYGDINNITELLTKLVSSYRLLIGGAAEINNIALASKGDVKKAIKRADEVGNIIDQVIDVLEHSSTTYMDYCKIKSEVMEDRVQLQYIQTEIDEELKFKES